jgi:hypothetical protein
VSHLFADTALMVPVEHMIWHPQGAVTTEAATFTASSMTSSAPTTIPVVILNFVGYVTEESELLSFAKDVMLSNGFLQVSRGLLA